MSDHLADALAFLFADFLTAALQVFDDLLALLRRMVRVG